VSHDTYRTTPHISLPPTFFLLRVKTQSDAVHDSYTRGVLRTRMERREFVAGVGGLTVTRWLDVSDSDSYGGGRKHEVIARRTVEDGTDIPVRLREGSSVMVKMDVEEGSGFSVAVIGLSRMERKRITGEDELVVEIEEEGEYVVDVTGEGRAQIHVVRG